MSVSVTAENNGISKIIKNENSDQNLDSDSDYFGDASSDFIRNHENLVKTSGYNAMVTDQGKKSCF